MTSRLTILIVGGYGTFGGRLAVLLADNPRLELIIAGRSLAKAEAFVSRLPPGCERRAIVFDREGDADAVLARERPNVLVDCTGPFQDYGTTPYRLVRACIAHGVHYLDLADGADFVAGISQFDADARTAGVFALSGVSSFPVLTAAVVRALGVEFAAIDSVVGGIAPSPYAGVGLNVIRAIAGYAGQPTRVVRDGAITQAFPLTESRRYTIAPPGRLPLKSTRFSLVEVPDLLLVPAARPEIRNMWVGAGPVPEVWHRALNALAWLVRLKLLRSLAPLAPLCLWAINNFRWGEHRGGMFIEVSGEASDGQRLSRAWHMLAEGDDGPFVPSMAVAALVLKMLDGAIPLPGARPATSALELTDYDRIFAGRAIVTGRRGDLPAKASLYQRALEGAWATLPPSLRAMHEGSGRRVARGIARVSNGSSVLAHLARRLFGFPGEGAEVPVSVTFVPSNGSEIWTRQFGTARFSSTQIMGTGRNDKLLVEAFGPVRVALAVVVDAGRLSLVVRRWSMLGMPMPMWLAPGGEAYEFEQDGRFHFHVDITHPLTGLIVGYEGWLDAPAA